ncbi:TKL protein kinase [Phytophthora nicotianae P10297]|uniref:TKL protein kinase n=1 Tax=Phytophthora nicotianae P10297 TaxID=1317064 RepID=W2Z9L2_PHYNI|nr:TKL protein kinase [Phytophthora nicotianae P10297]
MRSFSTALLTVLSIKSTAAQVCSTEAKTLTTSCGYDVCGAYEPCLAYNITDCSTSGSTDSSSCTTVGDDECTYKCFRAFGAYNSDPTQFVFIVSYNEQNDSDDGIYATANNQIVTAIDQLTLSPQTTRVWIEGGGYQQTNKGKVVGLEFADDFLSSQSQVTSVSLVAMDLSTRIYDIPNMLPNSITELSLSNTLLRQFPSHVAALTNLVTLHLGGNYITTVNSSITWDKLVVLDLQQNSLTTFEGPFPGLTDLNLNGNNLSEIPAIVFSFQYLARFSIQNNSLSSRSFTESQITFLQRLASLDLTESDFQNPVNCSLSEQRVIGINNVVVCVSNRNINSTSSASSSSSESSDSSASSVPISGISYSSGSSSADNAPSGSGASILAATISTVFFVLIALTATALYYHKQRNKEKVNDVYNNMHRGSRKQPPLTIWDDEELLSLQVNCDDIDDIRVIGSGSVAVVWLVRYRSSVLLASKRLREDTECTQDFVDEIKLVSKLDHPNIVAFIGTAWTTGPDLQALFELVENGDLCSYLSPALPRYWTRVKLQLAVDVVEALVYVHAFTPPLVHRNLNSHNVLISTDMQAKLTDFGVSSSQYANRWLAPEIITGSSDYDQSADIFAFGILLSEFDTHLLPYEDAVGSNDNILQMVASGSLRPTFSDTCPPIILELAKQCMSQEPRDRPQALKIAYVLRTLQREAFNL